MSFYDLVLIEALVLVISVMMHIFFYRPSKNIDLNFAIQLFLLAYVLLYPITIYIIFTGSLLIFAVSVSFVASSILFVKEKGSDAIY